MAVQVNTHEAKTRLSELIALVEKGEDVTIARAGKPVVRLVAVASSSGERVPGRMAGMIWVSPDFDDPLPPDVLASFYESPAEPAEAAAPS